MCQPSPALLQKAPDPRLRCADPLYDHQLDVVDTVAVKAS